VHQRHPGELTTAECRAVLRELARAAPLHVVFTGGDPFKRPDLYDLIDAARELELPVSVSPSATPLLTAAALQELRARGVEAMSLSLDGSAADRHDAIRGVPGAFAQTLDLARAAVATALPLQLNTLVSRETLDDLPAIYALTRELGAQRWSLFFLVQVGRGAVLEQISPEECETLMRWLADLPRGHPLVTTTEAPHYRRVVREHTGRHGGHGAGVRDGNGIMFISHTGEVYPSGFLPLVAGSVRTASPLTIYRDSALFHRLRKPDTFVGRCGTCALREECGGSRARAYADSGDPFGEDPLCLRSSEAEAALAAV